MGGIINLCKPLEIQVGVDLGCGDLGMAEHLLHSP